MSRVYISVGSNINREFNVRSALSALHARYGELTVSRVYESPAVGFAGDNFLNLVVGFDTHRGLQEVAESLREIEAQHLRVRSAEQFRSRTLDLDLLLYGEVVAADRQLQIPREEITRYAFVLGPLAEIAAEERHPVLHKTYAELWRDFDQQSQPMWPVELAE